MKLTNWFHPSIKPVHKGWYHTGLNDFNPTTIYLESGVNWWWNGSKWGFFNENKFMFCDTQDRWWRGIAKD